MTKLLNDDGDVTVDEMSGQVIWRRTSGEWPELLVRDKFGVIIAAINMHHGRPRGNVNWLASPSVAVLRAVGETLIEIADRADARGVVL